MRDFEPGELEQYEKEFLASKDPKTFGKKYRTGVFIDGKPIIGPIINSTLSEVGSKKYLSVRNSNNETKVKFLNDNSLKDIVNHTDRNLIRNKHRGRPRKLRTNFSEISPFLEQKKPRGRPRIHNKETNNKGIHKKRSFKKENNLVFHSVPIAPIPENIVTFTTLLKNPVTNISLPENPATFMPLLKGSATFTPLPDFFLQPNPTIEKKSLEDHLIWEKANVPEGKSNLYNTQYFLEEEVNQLLLIPRKLTRIFRDKIRDEKIRNLNFGYKNGIENANLQK